MNIYHRKFRRYFASLSKVEGFTNWVIAKIRFKINNSDTYHHEDDAILNTEIKKQKKNYAVIVTGDDRINFEVYLIRIINKSGEGFNYSSVHDAEMSEPEFEEHLYHENMFFYDSVVFEKHEILDFVQNVGDQNPIHRTEKAVVPGFLMLEHLLEKEDILACDIKYILPVFEGEKIEIYRNEKKFEAWVFNCIDGSYVRAVRVFEVQLL